jgi:lipid A 3-O-deacylase
VIGVKDYWNWVWDYQLKNEMGINVHASYAQSLIDLERHSFFQISPISQLTLGTTFINAAQGVFFQVGK